MNFSSALCIIRRLRPDLKVIKEISMHALFLIVMLGLIYSAAIDCLRVQTVSNAMYVISSCMIVSPGLYLKIRELFFPHKRR